MLECILCGKIIVQNDNPKHYSICSECDVRDLTQKQQKTIKNQLEKRLKNKG